MSKTDEPSTWAFPKANVAPTTMWIDGETVSTGQSCQVFFIVAFSPFGLWHGDLWGTIYHMMCLSESRVYLRVPEVLQDWAIRGDFVDLPIENDNFTGCKLCKLLVCQSVSFQTPLFGGHHLAGDPFDKRGRRTPRGRRQ